MVYSHRAWCYGSGTLVVRAFAILLVLLFYGWTAFPVRAATTVYVRVDGSDTLCNGTANAPASAAPNCAFATVPKAVTDVASGGTVNVAPGTYGATVIINQTLTLRGAQFGVDARTRPGTSAGESILTGGVFVNANSVVVDGFTIQGVATGPGLTFNKDFSGYQVLNNIVQDNVFAIYLNASGVLPTQVRFNLLRANNRGGAAGGDAIYSDQGLRNVLIDRNTFADQNVSAVDLSSITAGQQHTITISNNLMQNCGRPLILLLVTSTVVTGNTITGSTLAASGAIGAYGGVSGVTISGNNIVSGAGAAVQLQDGTNGFFPNSNIVVNYNRIAGNAVGIRTPNGFGYSGTLNAENNWWGCNGGPGAAGCDTVSTPGVGVDTNPWLVLQFSASPTTAYVGQPVTLTADLRFNSLSVDVSSLGFIPNGTPVQFDATLGTLQAASSGTTGGRAQTTYSGTTPGMASVSATLDTTLTGSVTVLRADTTTQITGIIPEPVAVGRRAVIHVQVSPVAPSGGTPGGSVTVSGGGAMCVATLAADGTGSCSFVIGQVGTYELTASYSGATGYKPSSGTAQHQVTPDHNYLPLIMRNS